MSDMLVYVSFLCLKEVVHMEVDWHWKSYNKKLEKEGKDYELWRIWWSICTTRTKDKIG